MKIHSLRRCVVLAALISLVAAAPALADGLPEFTHLVKQVSPAVVNISTTQRVEGGYSGGPDTQDRPFGDWLHRFFGNPGAGGDRNDDDGASPPNDQAAPGGNGGSGNQGYYETSSLGSGFIISSDGYILTNYHVVKDADKIVVKLSDRREFPAKVLGHDALSDIALLKIKAKHLPVVKIGSDKDLEPGQWVLAIGSPYGFDHSVTAGIVSALRRSLSDEEYVPFIQTDVAINPGNSGGPLLNTKGEVVGINSQIYSRTGGYMGLSFAIPIDVAMNVVKELEAHGHVTRGWLGVVVQGVNLGLAKAFGLKSAQGALVSRVLPNSPAAKSGFQAGDVILKYNGVAVDNSGDLPPLVGRSKPGKDVQVDVWRNGTMKSLSVSVGRLPQNGPPEPGSDQKAGAAGRLGLAVQDLDDQQRQQLDVDQGGVLVSSVTGGAAEDAGIQQGDVLLKIDGKPVKSKTQFGELVNALPAGKSVAILLERQQQPLFLAMTVPKKRGG